MPSEGARTSGRGWHINDILNNYYITGPYLGLDNFHDAIPGTENFHDVVLGLDNFHDDALDHRKFTDPLLPSDIGSQKDAEAISGASAILVVFLILTLSIFLALRIFDAARIIHMNMEVALLMAHFCLLLTSDLARTREIKL